MLMYVLRPYVGTILALVFYFVIRGGVFLLPFFLRVGRHQQHPLCVRFEGDPHRFDVKPVCSFTAMIAQKIPERVQSEQRRAELAN
jgi:hypothetical protein